MTCPPWDYKLHPNRFAHIATVQKELVDAIYDGADQLANCCDPRDVHRRLFRALAPLGHAYYAGNYRGSKKYPCLANAETTVNGKKTAAPRVVGFEMTHYATKLKQAILELDGKVAGMPRAQQVIAAMRLATNAFVRLQGIHPFWDGNGHVGRYVVMAILGRYGLRVALGWNIDDHPNPAYDDLITEYRQGKPDRLEAFVLQRIVDPKVQP